MNTEEAMLNMDDLLAQMSVLKNEMNAQERKIRISQIDSELTIYRQNTLVLYGVVGGIVNMISLLDLFDVRPEIICTEEQEHWGLSLNGIKVISQKDLEKLQSKVKQGKTKKEIVVQIALRKDEYDGNQEEIQRLQALGCDKIISNSEALDALGFMSKGNMTNICPEIMELYAGRNSDRMAAKRISFVDFMVKNQKDKHFLYLCIMEKAGDHTLMHTLQKHRIKHEFMFHSPEAFHRPLVEKIPQKVKIFAAIREPISRDLSRLYEQFTMMFTSDTNRMLEYNLSNPLFQDGGDAQLCFDLYYDSPQARDELYSIGHFMERFKENILDLSQYPFDKEKGYTIIQEGNVEVFVYQLEKMNQIVKEASQFVGGKPFHSWVKGNEASSKWIHTSYKEAQKKLRISQEYFDRSYNCPWLSHFYSPEDIEKFKGKWRSHIDPEK